MPVRRLVTFFCLAFLFPPALPAQTPASSTDKITVETSSTSIYIGKVTLTVTSLSRQDGVYTGEYKAKVFPYWFMSEHGSFRMKVSDDQLAQVARGETVEFAAEAENTDKEVRKVTGRASPIDAAHGKFKIRIFVTEKIQLIFNSTYKFGE